MGTFAIVFILPEDINITAGSTKYHRNFMDIYLSQFDKSYLYDLMEYQKVLLQRNALLKDLKVNGRAPGSAHELDVWDEGLLKPALKIMASRKAFSKEITENVGTLIARFSGTGENVQLSYRPKMALQDDCDINEALSILKKERDRELKHGFTVTGPHRDAYDISIGNLSLRRFGSLGQKKMVMIAMKIAALQVLSAHRGEPAILVLDEAFAALDKERANWLLSLLSGIGQVFLASAIMSGLDIHDKIKIFDLREGKVKERRE